MSINKDKLIRMMYERPVLWNHRHVDYRSGLLKQQAWVQMATEFHMTEEDLKKKWACVRDTFRRELRKILKLSTETVPYTSKWPYFDKMIFLKDTMDARKSFIDETEEEIENGEEDCDESHEDTKNFKDISTDRNDLQSVQTDIPYTFGNFQIIPRKVSIFSDPLEINNKEVKKRSASPNSDLEKEETSRNKKKPVDEDDDYHFVMSILPSLRTVSNKMKVRMAIMNVIVSAEKKEVQ